MFIVLSQITLYGNIFRHLDNAFHSSTRHMKATQTNMEESEFDNSEQEKDSDDQPRQSELVPKRVANRSPHQTQTPQTYFTAYERITKNSM